MASQEHLASPEQKLVVLAAKRVLSIFVIIVFITSKITLFNRDNLEGLAPQDLPEAREIR